MFFSSTKNDENNENPLWASCGKSSTELLRDFCARIDPLQLGVVLVSFISTHVSAIMNIHFYTYRLHISLEISNAFIL